MHQVQTVYKNTKNNIGNSLNLRYISNLTWLNKPEQYSTAKIITSLPVKKVPDTENWRLGLIDSLVQVKSEKCLMVHDTKHICAMLDSLCST